MSRTQENTQIDKPVCTDVVDLKKDIPREIDIYMSSMFHQDDNTKISQGQFNVSLMHIYNKYICKTDIKINDTEKEYQGYSYLNDKLLQDIYNIYITLCMVYKKTICFYGFSCISGIDTDTLTRWLTDKKASRTKQDISKKLQELSQETLKDFLVDGQRNPVGVLAVLNNLHGWSDKRTVITHERPTESLDSIAEKIGVKRLEG